MRRDREIASSHWTFISDSSTNNEAENGGLLCVLDGLSLLIMVPLGVCPLVQVLRDSKLVTQQVKRAWRVRILVKHDVMSYNTYR